MNMPVHKKPEIERADVVAEVAPVVRATLRKTPVAAPKRRSVKRAATPKRKGR